MKSKNIASSIDTLLDDFFLVQKDVNRVTGMYALVIREVELAMINKIMRLTHGNKTQVAKILGISRNTLNTKIKNLAKR